MIDTELLGFVYHWGLDINNITVIGEPYTAAAPQELEMVRRQFIHRATSSHVGT